MSLLLSSRCRLTLGVWGFLFGALFMLFPLLSQGQESESISKLIKDYTTKGAPSKDNPEKQRVKNQLLKALQQALANVKTPTDLYPVATLIEELAEKEYDRDVIKVINLEGQKLTRSLTDPLLVLARRNDWRMRYVALRTLGKITPDPEDVIPVMKATLLSKGMDSSVLEPRRSAAYALTDLARYAHLLTPPSPPLHRDFIKQLKTYAQVTQAAHLGMSDPDELVRGYSLLGVVEAASGFKELIVPQRRPNLVTPLASPIFEDAEFYLADKEYHDEFANIVDEFARVNVPLLAGLQDANNKIRLASLEAIEQIADGRGRFLRYARSKTNFPEEEGRVFRIIDDKSKKFLKIIEIEVRDAKMKVLATEEIKLKDPLQRIAVDDRGQSLARLLDPGTDLTMRRKAVHILESLTTDLQLFEDDPQQAILNRLAEVLNNSREDLFLRWGAVNIINDLVRNQDEKIIAMEKLFEKKKIDEADFRGELKRGESLLRKVLTLNLDVSLCNIVIERHAYGDPNLARAAAYALEGLGYLAYDLPGSELEKRRLGAEFVSMLQNLFFINCNGRQTYDAGTRYDVDTRKAALRVVVSVGGVYVRNGADIAIAALERDPDPDIRRAVAEALGKVGPLPQRIVDALLNALRHDTDPMVRMTVSETLISAPRAKE